MYYVQSSIYLFLCKSHWLAKVKPSGVVDLVEDRIEVQSGIDRLLKPSGLLVQL